MLARMAMVETPRLRTALHGGAVVVTLLTPKIAEAEVGPIRADLEPVTREHGWRLVFDMSGVLLVGSAGLALLIGVRKDAMAQGGRLVICNVSQEIMGMMKITHLTKLLTFAPDVPGAVAMA